MCFEKILPCWVDAVEVSESPRYKQARDLRASVIANLETKQLELVVALLDRQYQETHSRRDYINARAQAVLQFISVFSPLVVACLGAAIVATKGKNWVDAVSAIGLLLVVAQFAITGHCLLRALAFRTYQFYAVDDLLKKGDLSESYVRADQTLSAITAIVHNDEQNNRKATYLEYAHVYITWALWTLLATLSFGVITHLCT